MAKLNLITQSCLFGKAKNSTLLRGLVFLEGVALVAGHPAFGARGQLVGVFRMSYVVCRMSYLVLYFGD